MSDYLTQIETAYGQFRGKFSLLKPLDWDLAGRLEKRGIPINVVLLAMEECGTSYRDGHPTGTINTLRYFEQAVEARFRLWVQNQAGRSTGEVDSTGELDEAHHAIKRLELITEKFGCAKKDAPVELRRAMCDVGSRVFQLILEVEAGTDLYEVEQQLVAAAEPLNRLLVESAGADEANIVEVGFYRDFPNVRITEDLFEKLLLKVLYAKYDLPRVTLIEL